MPTFTFQPRWKEELICSGPGGVFVLDCPMGIFSVYLPTEESWKHKCPGWAQSLWPILCEELKEWCKKNKAELYIDPTADVY